MRLTPGLMWAVIAAIFFIPFLGNVHLFDWDEINFAEIAREMIVSGNYGEPQINFVPFTEKPPLFFWLQAISMRIFGVNEFAARFPNALLGVLVLPLIYSIGKKLRDHKFGMLWTLVYFGTILPHLYFKSGIIDPWFNFFIFSSIYCLIQSDWHKKKHRPYTSWIIAGGIMLGLAILTKGPASVMMVALTFLVIWMLQKFRLIISWPQLFLFGIITILVTGIWFGVNYLQRGDKFLIDFTVRQWELLSSADAGHDGFFFFHFVILFFGCFPATAFYIQALLKKPEAEPKFLLFREWMIVLFWVVLILFTLVRTKIIHYSSLAYYPLTFLAAISLYHLIEGRWKLQRWMKFVLVITALPFIIGPIGAAIAGQNMDKIAPRVPFEKIDADLTANVNWTGWECLPGIVLLISVIAFIVYSNRGKLQRGVYILFIGSAIFMQTGLFFFIGRVETYSQRAGIEFWKKHAKENAYLLMYGHRTFTTYFYGEVKPQANKNYSDQEWLKKGDIDKPVYIAVRLNKKARLEEEIPDAEYLYKEDGYYFYRRLPRR